ncbi:DDT domain-containing protein DDR4 [Ricinus communis]|uniref:tRNA ligase, putative n=1 Tax=Ricinus communis TaxID=3988 RepID=B9R920_RICCO|nr:DDT domain-containing protein DDR4 [Ricinus communis]EEF52097.1 tRNA ligase, putative [Ricinus communis]|eukprot:XP_002511495.1 DDT domain-containing protein DDR4 [Ricinus communis]
MSREQQQPSSPIPQNDTVTVSNGVSTPTNEAPAPVPTPTNRSNRPSRACTLRAAERLQAAQQAAAIERKQKPNRKDQQQRLDESPQQKEQCSANSKIITPLVGAPEPAQLPRWSLRSMWELASVLNFLHVFRPLLNIQIEFSAEEFETALITPNDTLGDIHMPLLKAIPPITRMALTRDTWITVLCRKLRDWWHWVADGELPIVASHGAEVEVYKTLDPGIRVVILKALCDIRVEQEDIRNYIDNSVKHGIQLSVFRKERVGGDSQGINYWYEDDPIIGHRLYREIRKVEVKKAKVKGSQVLLNASYQWETVATNFEEFQDVSEKLFASKNRTEASLGKKLKNDMLSEIEKVHKRKERLLKKQHRQALLLDNFLSVDGLGPGRSLRDRKPVTYTFDDYDRSINEAIKITKRKPPSPEPIHRREGVFKPEASENGKWSGPSDVSHGTFNLTPPDSPGYDDMEEEHKTEQLDRSNRRRQRPQRYSAKEFVEAVSDNEADFDSDDDIVGEAVYDEEYLRKRKQRRKFSSSSEGDEEYRWDDENGEDEEEEEEEEEDSLSISEDSDEPQKFKKLPGRTRRETKLRSVHELQSGLRRSKRATRNRINYRQYELSESEGESMKPAKSNASDENTDASENAEYSAGSQDSDDNDDEEQDMKVDRPVEDYNGATEKVQSQPPEKSNSPGQDEVEGVRKRRFLDLNELAPGSSFDDGPNTVLKDEDRDDF